MAPPRLHRVCSIANCGKPHYGRGWCATHYQRWLTRGTVEPGKTPEGEPERYFREVVLPFAGDGCLLWPYGNKAYGVLKRNNRNYPVHRLACEEIHGPPPTPKHEAAHRCGNSRCCNPGHVRWATHSENQLDRIQHDTHVRGERHHKAKLSEMDVVTIRGLRGKITQREVSSRFGISITHVRAIQSGASWAWLK